MTEPVIRLFVSSTADVCAERQRVAMAVDRLNGEFAGHVRIEAILWDENFYSSHAGLHEQIAEAAECDSVIEIFGGRLGTTLPDSFPCHPVTGESYPSSTDYEAHLAWFDSAIAALSQPAPQSPRRK
nr:DUF4062 domain-containing protein [uncultured Rhodopila sp.]